MPTMRRKRASRRIGLSAAALEAWRQGDFHGVNRDLGIRSWEVSPFDATEPEPPEWSDGGPWHHSWPRAWELRQALIEAAGAPGEVGRHGEPLGPAKPR
jgi:hypothetical protein